MSVVVGRQEELLNCVRLFICRERLRTAVVMSREGCLDCWFFWGCIW